MPRQKDLKRLVRTRMRKTGESYTAARAQILRKPRSTDAPAGASPAIGDAPKPNGVPAAPVPSEYARIAGMSDDVVKEKTGCTWERWVKALDRLGAQQLPHREIVALVQSKYRVGDWWGQMVTVGYERIKGLRTRGQRRDGTHEATKSRTYLVSVATLFDAWEKPGVRRRWLPRAGVRIRTATAPKSMRLDWPDGGIIAVGFQSRGKDKSSVALSHAGLADAEAAARVKEYWAERLEALAEVLAVRRR